MKSYEFSCFGHKNILATHKNTLEFTKDEDLSLKGDCILGVRADFDFEELKKFIKGKRKLLCTLFIDDIMDDFEFEINNKFNDEHEIVIRLGEYQSDRTLGVRSNKSSKHINREVVDKLKKRKKLKVVFHEKDFE